MPNKTTKKTRLRTNVIKHSNTTPLPLLSQSQPYLRQAFHAWRSLVLRWQKTRDRIVANASRYQTSILTHLFVMSVIVLLIVTLPIGIKLFKPVLIQFHVISTPVMVPQVQANSSAVPMAENGTLNYSALGLQLPLWHTNAVDPLDSASWQDIRTTLKKGVALTYTSDFKNAPLVYIIGHSSDYTIINPYASAFAPLGQAKVGDTFSLNLGQTFTYTVRETKVIHPTDVATVNSLQPGPGDHVQRVVLVTCWPIFTTQNRLLVIGERALP